MENLQEACTFQTFPQTLKIYQWIGIKIFSIEKWVFKSVGNSAHTAKGLALEKALLILLSLYLQMLKMLISTQNR